MSSRSFRFVQTLSLTQATDDGSTLIIVNMETRKLFTVDPETGDATQIDLGGELLPGTGSDGLVRSCSGMLPKHVVIFGDVGCVFFVVLWPRFLPSLFHPSVEHYNEIMLLAAVSVFDQYVCVHNSPVFQSGTCCLLRVS